MPRSRSDRFKAISAPNVLHRLMKEVANKKVGIEEFEAKYIELKKYLSEYKVENLAISRDCDETVLAVLNPSQLCFCM